MNSLDAIRIQGLEKRYGGDNRCSWAFAGGSEGSMFGFLGPNGSGKSTTIGCLTGLLDPTGGSVEILGEPFTSESAGLKRRMGVMPQNLGLFDHLYAHEFLAFVARMFGLSENETRRRVPQLLAALELVNGRRRLGAYSTGMRKRVAFAAAVIHSPEVLFLDEPFESIDPAGVAMMKEWLRRFMERGGTVFITSHVLDTVVGLCDRVAIVVQRANWCGRVMLRGWATAA